MTEKKDYIMRLYREGDWDKALEMILGHNSNLSFTTEYWTWRNKLSPHFDPSLVLIAEDNGKVIACAHTQIWTLKISQLLAIKGALGTDLFVRAEYRRRGIASEIINLMRRNMKEKDAIIFIGMTRATTYAKFQSKRGAYTIPSHLNCKTAYTKNLNCETLRRKASMLNNIISEHPEIKRLLIKLNMVVLFRLKGYPPFVLEASQGEVSIKEGESINRPNIVVTTSRELSSSTKTLSMIRMFFTGDVKVKGLLSNAKSLIRLYRILKKVSS